jgi:ArsR family transcriptional regulator
MGALKRASQPVCICDFTAAFDLSQPTISHHMAKLRDAGLVEVTKKGIWAYYRLADRLDARTRALLDVLV